jgi:phosphoribosyl-ATP pyrophosphohydrolase
LIAWARQRRACLLPLTITYVHPKGYTMNAPTSWLPASYAGAASTRPHDFVVDELERLYCALPRLTWAENPRTARLMSAGLRKMSQKVVAEAAEVALEAVRKHTDTTVLESADLLYHLVILWYELGIRPADVWAEMRHRAETIGIAEKPPKRPGRATTQQRGPDPTHPLQRTSR